MLQDSIKNISDLYDSYHFIDKIAIKFNNVIVFKIKNKKFQFSNSVSALDFLEKYKRNGHR